MELGEAGDIRAQLKKVPDLERLLSKIHTAGDMKRNQTHPDSRAVMFDMNVYSKRKIMDLLICLDGFKKSMEIMRLLQVGPYKKNMKNKNNLLTFLVLGQTV